MRSAGGPRQNIQPDSTELKAVYSRILQAHEMCVSGPDADALISYLARCGSLGKGEQEEPSSPTGLRLSDSFLGASWRGSEAQEFLAAFIEAESQVRCASWLLLFKMNSHQPKRTALQETSGAAQALRRLTGARRCSVRRA